jgi:hypothetical protein
LPADGDHDREHWGNGPGTGFQFADRAIVVAQAEGKHLNAWATEVLRRTVAET